MLAISEGVTALTRIPFRLASRATTRAIITMAAIAPPSTLSPGVAILAASEATSTMLPPPWRCMTGRNARVNSIGGSA